LVIATIAITINNLVDMMLFCDCLFLMNGIICAIDLPKRYWIILFASRLLEKQITLIQVGKP
jgi:hypothetical protein